MAKGKPFEECVHALEYVTYLRNILIYDKISNNRLRIYFKDEQIAKPVTKNHKTIKVLEIDIQIRPLIMLSRRIIISNASPEIPNIFIENALRNVGLKPVSTINFLSVGLKKPKFEHALSSRRYVYVACEFDTLAKTTTIEYEGLIRRICLTGDSIYCTYRRKYGHSAEVCRFKEKYEQITTDFVNLNQIYKANLHTY